MLHKPYPQCIDPNLLNVNEHLDSANLAYDCFAPFDDVQIATGQASFDDDDEDGHVQSRLSTWINPYHSRGLLEDPDDVFAFSDNNSTQAHSAPARHWDIEGFERSDSAALLQYEGSSPVREGEPWSHLQTFALSAPGHNDQCSQDFQIEAISQWSLNWQDNEMLRSSATESRHQRQASVKHSKMQEDPYSTAGYRTQPSRLRNQAGSARGLHLANFDTWEHSMSHAGEQRMAGSSTSSSFSQPATSGLHAESQILHSRSTLPLHDPTFNELKGSNTISPNSGLINDSAHNSLPANQNALTPQELSWRQHDHLPFEHPFSTSDDTAYGSYDLGLTPHHHAWRPGFVQDPAFGYATCRTYDDTKTLEYPGAIKIEGSSGHYKPDLPSSFPPSADCFPPDHMPTMQKPRPYRATASNSQPNIKLSNKPTSARGSRSSSLSIIREYGHSQQGSPILSRNGSVKGKRKGPLATATALAAAQKRKDGSVCIRCRTMKMTCKGGLPCEGCRQITKVKLWDQSCTPANFIDMVKEGTCNAVFQHSISHLALDGSRRLVVPVPTAFNVSTLLARLESCHSRYDIRVRHSSNSSYTLDLSSCFRLLTKMQKSYAFETCELQDFVRNKHLRPAWLQCVREYDPATSVVDRSIQLNNMPSRNSYEVSPHNKFVPGHALDVEDQQDRGTIIFAVQLARIILRALEIEAFEALQKAVNELTKGGKSDADIETLIGQLGQILMSLRWRISWWAIVGDSPDEGFISRVTKLAQILYCYYFVAIKKMSPWSGQLPSKIRSIYADVEPLYEDLPVTDSLDGFHAFMEKGKAIVQAAKVQQNIPRSLPTAPMNPNF